MSDHPRAGGRALAVLAIGAALGTSAQLWLNLEAAYQLDKMPRNDDSVQRRARIYGLAPLKDLIKRYWIQPSKDLDDIERQLKKFFETDTLDREPQFQPYAAKAAVPLNPAQRHSTKPKTS